MTPLINPHRSPTLHLPFIPFTFTSSPASMVKLFQIMLIISASSDFFGAPTSHTQESLLISSEGV